MIIQKKSLVKLRDFGLNTYESKIWSALLSRGVSTAGELSDIANVPRSRSYDVLESLEKKGFVSMKQGKPIKYITVPPKEVLERVKKNTEIKTIKQIKTIDDLKTGSVIKELGKLYEQGSSTQNQNEISGSLTGRKNLYNHLGSMLRNVKNSVEIMTNVERFEDKTKHFKGIFDNLNKKRVKIKVALNSIKNLKPNQSFETRKTDINARFCIVDGKEVLFMLFGDGEIHPNYDIGIWVVNESFAGNMKNIFNKTWEKHEFSQ
jgi:sugar-specific transcriptional regulator TrmB